VEAPGRLRTGLGFAMSVHCIICVSARFIGTKIHLSLSRERAGEHNISSAFIAFGAAACILSVRGGAINSVKAASSRLLGRSGPQGGHGLQAPGVIFCHAD
jgi:hypothetical protein